MELLEVPWFPLMVESFICGAGCTGFSFICQTALKSAVPDCQLDGLTGFQMRVSEVQVQSRVGRLVLDWAR